ncbi:hypothetical protein BU23DRAFT_601575 [Bimuria novae-zelandiae CBS 107.79]|uniref:Uncharacterized protein n=1 Tax=Bimuria novae-zelandiae CBS 107.79 TaxID=1447943 RepID=A0A6A5UY49_9PLEO|nr:hypothetical protein BU23DRAFT_601575 [Bimuria novae-zelandiae CBS 107.79]
MELSITMIAAVSAGVGALIIGLIVLNVILLVRKHREHHRYMANLDEREIAIAKAQENVKRKSIAKPRAVLRRNTILPFNSESGWGNLPSVETIDPPKTPSILPHYAPPKPSGFLAKPKRLSWSFLGRRSSGKAIPMKGIRVSVLSTVVESPKPSPLAPVLSGPLAEPSSTQKIQSHTSSDESLLNQHHPYFRNQKRHLKSRDDTLKPEPLRRSLTVKATPTTEIHSRLNRSQSVADIPDNNNPGKMTRFPRPQLHARSVSTSSQASGNPPIGGLLVPPLEIARIKAEARRQARRRSLLSRSPSQQSNSSYDSGNSYILATQPSLIMASTNSRVQKVAKREFRNSMIIGPRPFCDTLTLHGRNKQSQGSTKRSVARFSSATPATQTDLQAEKRNSLPTNSSSLYCFATKLNTADPVTLSGVSSPANSPLAIRGLATPKRRSGSHVTLYGSPEERRKSVSVLKSVSEIQSCPERQLSQASTQASSRRSSNGNPFQWDPAPMSAGRPSALKGSPSARKLGHKRQNCVRISLIPTELGSPSRSPSPCIHDVVEKSPQASSDNVQDPNLRLLSTRSLPRPPNTSFFAPGLKFNTTNIRASLTASSPTLSMTNYDQVSIVTPRKTQDQIGFPGAHQQNNHRMSTCSEFSIPSFPSPCHDLPEYNVMHSPPPTFALSPPSNGCGDNERSFDEMAMVSSPFEAGLSINSSPGGILLLDQCTPDFSYAGHQTPTDNLDCNFSSPFTTIPEEPSANCDRVQGYAQYRPEDSPPCSPKTVPSRSYFNRNDRAAYSLPIKNTTIPEEPLDIIDPAILTKDAFTSLNGPFDNRSGSVIEDLKTNRTSIHMPSSPLAAVHAMQPLIDAVFPPMSSLEPPGLFIQSSPSSLYSSPSPSPSFPPLPMAPSSPRPAHAQLPTITPALNFAAMPMLTPCGPRDPPPRSLRSSIQTLRRMNSDTKKGGKEERRYANLGREDIIKLPGEESWLEDLDAYANKDDEALDEEKGRALIGDLGFYWEEDATMLELDSTFFAATVLSKSSSTSPKPTAKKGEDRKKEEKSKERKDELEPSSPRPSSPVTVTRDRSSSIWEDGEKFWASTPPPPQLSSAKKTPKRFRALSSSPASTRSSRKRAFEVAKDEAPVQEDTPNDKGKGVTPRERKAASGRYRKRSVLGVGTPNVEIHVIPPSSGVEGTLGSLYDADGFLSERYMAFRVEPIGLEDLPAFVDAIFRAHQGKNHWINTAYPDNLISAGQAQAIKTLQAASSHAERAVWEKAVDTATGEIVGGAIWFFYETRKSAASSSPSTDAELGEREEYMSAVGASIAKVSIIALDAARWLYEKCGFKVWQHATLAVPEKFAAKEKVRVFFMVRERAVAE